MKLLKFLIFILSLMSISCTNRDGEIIDLINSVKKQNDDLKAQITALKKTTDSAMVAITKVTVSQAVTDKKLDAIQTELKSVLAQISSLTTQMTAANADLASIKAKLDALQVKCAELVAQIAALTNNQNSGLVGEITSIIIDHKTSNGFAPVNKRITYGIYTSNVSGNRKMWITQNLGAERPGFSVDEANIISSGWYFQFNRKQGYQVDFYSRIPNTTWITKIDEDSNWLLTNDPCRNELGGKWRLPTMNEWMQEISVWKDGPFYSPLKLVNSGFLSSQIGGLNQQWGIAGAYWTNAQMTTTYAYYLGGGGFYFDRNDVKALGFPCRCISD